MEWVARYENDSTQEWYTEVPFTELRMQRREDAKKICFRIGFFISKNFAFFAPLRLCVFALGFFRTSE